MAGAGILSFVSEETAALPAETFCTSLIGALPLVLSISAAITGVAMRAVSMTNAAAKIVVIVFVKLLFIRALLSVCLIDGLSIESVN